MSVPGEPHDDLLIELHEAEVARLPDSQREALVLAYWGGMTADQIARRADVPLGTAKSRIRLGLAKLREDLRMALDAEPVAQAA